MADLRVAPVMRSNNYDKFKHLEGNRSVGARAEKIKKKIKEVGYIMCPIIINEKFEIIDGQGRFQALKDMHLPIDYIVAEGTGLEECIAMNLGQTNWTMADFIDSYIEQGNQSYVRLKELMTAYKLPYNSIISLTLGINGFGGKQAKIISEGRLELSQKDFAHLGILFGKLEKYHCLISRELDNNHQAVYINAIAFILQNDLETDERLYSQLEKNKAMLVQCSKLKQAFEYIEDACNYRSRSKKYFVHEYELHHDDLISKNRKVRYDSRKD